MWRWNKIPLAHFGTPPVVDSAVYQTHETRYFYSILKSVQNGILVIKSYVSVHGEYLDTQPPPPPPPPPCKGTKRKVHGGESRNILYLYLDRMGKNIRQCFFKTQLI